MYIYIYNQRFLLVGKSPPVSLIIYPNCHWHDSIATIYVVLVYYILRSKSKYLYARESLQMSEPSEQIRDHVNSHLNLVL